MSGEANNSRPRHSIVLPPVNGDFGFAMDTSVIFLIMRSCQFAGLPFEDPNVHLTNFLLISDCFNDDNNDISEDGIRLRLFPFSLRDKAIWWLRSLPTGSITTWEELVTQFSAKYSPEWKLAKLKRDIITFSRVESETLYRAKERFQDLLKRCPDHGISDRLQPRIFFEGLVSADHQSSLDVAIGGYLREYETTEAFDLIDEMAYIDYPCQKPVYPAPAPAPPYPYTRWSIPKLRSFSET